MDKSERKIAAKRLRREERLCLQDIATLVGAAKSSVSLWVRDDPLTGEEKRLSRYKKVGFPAPIPPRGPPTESKAPFAKAPFNEYRLYEHVAKKDGRHKVHLIHPKTRCRKTLTAARYKMCVLLKRELDHSEQVDHIDEDCTNDDFGNLQILTRRENVRKQASFRGQVWVELRCPWCRKLFQRKHGATYLTKKDKDYTSCSRSCGTYISSRRRKGHDPDLESAIRGNFVREFKKHLDYDAQGS